MTAGGCYWAERPVLVWRLAWELALNAPLACLHTCPKVPNISQITKHHQQTPSATTTHHPPPVVITGGQPSQDKCMSSEGVWGRELREGWGEVSVAGKPLP